MRLLVETSAREQGFIVPQLNQLTMSLKVANASLRRSFIKTAVAKSNLELAWTYSKGNKPETQIRIS